MNKTMTKVYKFCCSWSGEIHMQTKNINIIFTTPLFASIFSITSAEQSTEEFVNLEVTFGLMAKQANNIGQISIFER